MAKLVNIHINQIIIYYLFLMCGLICKVEIVTSPRGNGYVLEVTKFLEKTQLTHKAILKIQVSWQITNKRVEKL